MAVTRGITFSPFVKNADNENSDSYTLEDVEVMLGLIKEKGYNEVGTYGVGVRAFRGDYMRNITWRTQCTSIVYTGLAAAKLNIKNSNQSETFQVYQGLFADFRDISQMENEIDVGFEIADLANQAFPGTVTNIIFPSLTYTDQIFQKFVEIKRVSERTRGKGMRFGIRISDCIPVLSSKQDDQELKEVLKLVDFLICVIVPVEDNINSETVETFMESTVRGFEKTNKTIQKVANVGNLSVEMVLETGWPGVDNPNPLSANANIKNMLKYWSLIEKWAEDNNARVFMNEAIDNPWKARIGHLANHFGLWEHKNIDDNSKAAYKLKVPTKEPSKPVPFELIFGVVFGLILFTALALMILVGFKRMKRFAARTKLTHEEIRQFKNGTVTDKVVDENDTRYAWTRIPYNEDFELSKNKFSIDKNALLGSGAFGSVYRGRISGLLHDVAFKTTRPDCPVSALRGILSEIKILIYLGKHENIVSICGAYTAELLNGNVYIATELCSNGSLEKFLRTNKSPIASYQTVSDIRYFSPSSLRPEVIPDFQFFRWALEIASAMEYISSKNVILADLATRNVLLTLDLTAKVSDFGLSRRLYEYTEYVKTNQEPLPWRWMAPESLRSMEFSVKSDVWSYGMTLWEIFSAGAVPYAGLAWDVTYITRLENGLREQKPTDMPEKLFEVVWSCWELLPNTRPTFLELKNTILAISTQLDNKEKGIIAQTVD